MLGIPIILQNFIPIGKGVSFPRMRDFAHHFVYSSTVWEGMFFLSPPAKTPTPTFMENIKIKGRSHYARMRTYPTSCEHCLVVSSRVCWNRTGNNDDANSIRIRACVIAFSQFYWHCPQSMRSRVYETLRCPSVCLSVAACAPAANIAAVVRPARYIDRLLHGAQKRGGRMRAVPRRPRT